MNLAWEKRDFMHVTNFSGTVGKRGLMHITHWSSAVGKRGFMHVTHFSGTVGKRGLMHMAHWSSAVGKWVWMHVRKEFSQISLCSPSRLIRNDTFRLYGTFRFNVVSSYRKSSLGGKCRLWIACVDCTGLSGTSLDANSLSPFFQERRLKRSGELRTTN